LVTDILLYLIFFIELQESAFRVIADNYVMDDGRKRVLSIVLLLLAKTIIVFALLLGYLRLDLFFFNSFTSSLTDVPLMLRYSQVERNGKISKPVIY
jgi:small-conductance mechanosensitive channel